MWVISGSKFTQSTERIATGSSPGVLALNVHRRLESLCAASVQRPGEARAILASFGCAINPCPNCAAATRLVGSIARFLLLSFHLRSGTGKHLSLSTATPYKCHPLEGRQPSPSPRLSLRSRIRTPYFPFTGGMLSRPELLGDIRGTTAVQAHAR